MAKEESFTRDRSLLGNGEKKIKMDGRTRETKRTDTSLCTVGVCKWNVYGRHLSQPIRFKNTGISISKELIFEINQLEVAI